jgi:aspartyl/glutamyl-tRNA(Asn/Gln) amidotransferase C subunit
VLNELDTEKIETTSQTHGLVNVLREDEAEPGLDMDKYKNDRNFKKGYFVVDKVID